ncbi:proline--tRNA ligase [Anaerococcus degeneri]|uniref:Proline--tRNA ligase n=1 Tax=Anaerococcus degeneri TaxID=361500 RepID=A0ABS7Z347_9FIRM|nr:proline--tRNA ligase [Anaerococcus degeneri]MBP2014898.1 prolyl-tRNA synthetase [Anaerococcus degeneri]MCA2097107.1 proline--tRNA ligase [Anaerococcus degeneri]
MRLSNYYMPTLRQDPVDAETASHKLLVRGAFIRQQASGIYSFLPLGQKVLNKIETIVRDAMDSHGAIEVSTSILQPRQIWDKSTRWETFGPEMFKLKDRHDREYALGPTAEESFVDLIKDELNSYKQLPLNLYQIVDKFRDEKRPRFGINRSRDFLMKDAYTFDADQEGLEKSYMNMWKAYEVAFDKMKLDYKVVEGDTGAMGGRKSHEFIALSESGEGIILYTENSDSAYTDEKARSIIQAIKEDEKELELIKTTDKKTIEDVSEFLNEDKIKCAKAIDLIVEGEPVFVFIPGDRELNMAKMISYLKVPEHEIEMADDETIEKYTQPGYTGPIGLENARIIIDKSLTQINNLVVGANKAGYHYINANYGRDFEGETAEDLTLAKEGDQAYDGSGAYKAARGIEVGNIFQLGTKYSEALEANFLDQNGVSKPFIMGSYGIGISRSISAVVEQYHDDKGIIWPTSVAPFEVIITLIKPNDEEQANLAEKIYKELKAKKIDVLLDDRNERPGVKFNDRDLIGIPYRITVGKDAVNSIIEYSTRAEMENKNLDADEAIKLVCENIYKDLED